jgi:hypothetical protein
MRKLTLGLVVAVGLLAPASVNADAGSLPTVASGPRPGPDILYEPPASAPQLTNAGIWKAPPILVSGTTAYRDGEFLYQDFLYDDHGANGGTRDSGDPRSGDDTFSGPNGTYTYPTDQKRYAQNAADLVELRVRPQADATAFRITLNTMLDPDAAATTIAIGTSATPHAFPHDANATAPAQLFLTVHGTHADLVDAATGQPAAGPAPTATVDTTRRQITVLLPHADFDPGRGVVRLAAGVGLWDNANNRYLIPTQNATATQPGGAGTLSNPTAFFNVAFRTKEPWPTVHNGGTSTTSDPAWWRDQQQGDSLKTGDLSPFFADVDFGKLAAGTTDDSGVPATGPMDRILASHWEPAQGVDFNKSCGDATDCEGELLGRLQPYAIYVPKKPMPAAGYGMTLLLHSLGAMYNQFATDNNQTQLGERGGGSIVITPAGRGPDGWYWGLTGADTFEVWADVASRYKLDPDWTSISGYSMGGYGTYKFATEFPDLFARANPVVGPPCLGITVSGTDCTSGPQTSTRLMLPSVRNIPFLIWDAGQDELVPTSGVLAQIQEFDDLGYRYRFDLFNPAEHLTLAINDSYQPAADFLGTARVDRDPPHVTYVANRKMDFPGRGMVGDHAYWLSAVRLRTATGDNPLGTIDVRSEGFGVGDPPANDTQHGGGALTGGQIPAMPYAEQSRDWGKTPSAAPRDVLDITATNVGHVTIDPQRARVSCAAQLNVKSDGPVTVELAGCDRSAAVGAGSHTVKASRACRATAGFVRAAVAARGHGISFIATPAPGRRYDADVFRESAGRRVLGERRVAHFRNRRGHFAWSGKHAGDGFYVVRYTVRLGGGRIDVRRVALQRAHGRFHVRPEYYRRAGCGEVVSYKLTRPVFGGTTGRGLGIAFRLLHRARVTVKVLRGKHVVKTFPARTYTADATHRLRLAGGRRAPGDYRVRLTIGKATETLTSRRL